MHADDCNSFCCCLYSYSIAGACMYRRPAAGARCWCVLCVCVCIEAVAYTFGHAGGVIVYSFPDFELPDARRDQMAVGVVTSQRSAVLLRVVSGTSSDFIQIELVRISVYRMHVISTNDPRCNRHVDAGELSSYSTTTTPTPTSSRGSSSTRAIEVIPVPS